MRPPEEEARVVSVAASVEIEGETMAALIARQKLKAVVKLITRLDSCICHQLGNLASQTERRRHRGLPHQFQQRSHHKKNGQMALMLLPPQLYKHR